MQTSLLIARLAGPVLVVAGLTALFNPKHLHDVAREFLASPALIFIAGFMALLGGLAIVNAHNVWTPGWPLIITVFGWMAIAAGIVRIGFPGVVRSVGEAMMTKHGLMRGLGAVQAALGAFLMVKGYL